VTRIVLRGVGVVYDAGLPSAAKALDGVDLVVEAGESLAVIGPTGSGKTTLLEVLAGLTRPTSGSAAVEPSPPGATLQSLVGLAYQFPELQFFEETVYDDVAFGPRRQGLSDEAVRARTDDALSRAGLSPHEFARRPPHSLSEGEKRRAAIACILALGRPFLLLDEPTAGLDPLARRRVADLMRGELDAGHAVVLVTHDLELAEELATRVAVLAVGRIHTTGAPDSVFRAVGSLESLGLTPPLRYVLPERLRSRRPSEVERVERILFPRPLAEFRGG
jgi:energy-coupling factor transport system ATP-binding protein